MYFSAEHTRGAIGSVVPEGSGHLSPVQFKDHNGKAGAKKPPPGQHPAQQQPQQPQPPPGSQATQSPQNMRIWRQQQKQYQKWQQQQQGTP